MYQRPDLRLSVALLSLFAALASGCDCAGPVTHGIGTTCASGSDCDPGLVCRNQVCVQATDGGSVSDGAIDGSTRDSATCDVPCQHGHLCCAAGQECVDDLSCAPTCANTRCGDNHLTCCGAGQVCLDDVVCAASCSAGHALCGAALDLCCDAGQACVDHACVTPGAPCTNDYDCLTDNTYCEPTIGHCLGNPAGPLCEVRPMFDRIALAVEWHWQGVMVGTKLYVNVTSTPAIGDVNGDEIPDVVVPAYTGSDLNDATLVALSGDDGHLLWHVEGVNAPEAISAVALGNLDTSDAALEIVYKLASGPLRVLDGDGTTELARQTTGTVSSHRWGASLADMDHDGDVEIVAGCHVLAFEHAASGTGFVLRTIFDGGACSESSQGFAAVAVANLDTDPELEITSGGSAYDLSGTQFWTTTGAAGLPAVADLDADGTPEVVNVIGGRVIVRNGRTGAVHVGAGGDWLNLDVTIPGGGNGGAPTIADFDGDGLPEISAAGQGRYAVYDLDCVPAAMRRPGRASGDCMPGSTNFLRWSAVTQDISSSVTGSSVFDFQGDGIAEVVYNDECWLHVYDGSTGMEVLMMPRPNSSRTALEYPIVADVDHDGNSEIVVPANNDQAVTRDHCPPAYMTALGTVPAEFASGTHGVYSFGDPNDRWVRTRPIWNEYAYHVTNVDDHGGVPMSELDNWTQPGLNDYRTNVQGAGVFNAPNLTVTLSVVAQCNVSSMILSAVITNAGSRGVPAGVLVQLYQTTPGPEMLVGTAMTMGPLLPGGSERVTVTVTGVPNETDLVYEVRVDGASSTMPVTECHEDDNSATDGDRCNGIM